MRHPSFLFSLLHLDFPGQDPLVVLIVAGQQGGRIQPVGALGLVLVAVQAALDLLHLGLTGGAQMLCRGRAPEQQAHAGAVVDLDASRAGHTALTFGQSGKLHHPLSRS